MAAPREGIVVLGFPRSGTTLLRRLLNAHDDIVCPAETYVLSACARFLAEQRTGTGVDVGVLAGLGHAGFASDDVRGRLRELAFGFHRELAAREGKRRWAEKTPFDVFHVDEIERLCDGRVHFVCLVRHGLDVAVSTKELCDRSGSYLFELQEAVQRAASPLEGFVQLWRDANERLARLVSEKPEDAVLLRYEDLVAEPEAQLRRVLEFAGEAWSEGLVERALGSDDEVGLGDWKSHEQRSIGGASIGRWESLPPYTRSALGRIANPVLASLGYDEVPVVEPPTPEEARRRYEIMLRLRASRRAESDGS